MLRVALAVVLLTASIVCAQVPPRDKPATIPGVRTPDDIQQDLQRAMTLLQHAVGQDPTAIFDPDKRKELAPKVLASFKAILGLLDELAQAAPGQKEDILQDRLEYLALSAAFGDADAIAALDNMAKAEGPNQIDAQCARKMAAYWAKPRDVDAQNKVLDEMQKLAKVNPKSDEVAHALLKMQQMGPASPAMAERARKILEEESASELSVAFKAARLAEAWQAKKDEASQAKVLEDLQKLAKANPTSAGLVRAAAQMAQSGAATDALSQRAQRILTDELKSDAANEAVVQLKCLRFMQDWQAKSKDPAAQAKILEEVEKLAKENSKMDFVAQTLGQLAHADAASDELADRALAVLKRTMVPELADVIASQIEGEWKIKRSLNKPVVLAGTTLEGKPFSTADWKGKVILVSFWATEWDRTPQDLGRIRKVYIDWHAKGLEVVGVSCDASAEDLKAFLNQNRGMPWPQLFDANQNPKLRWHPLAKEWGINGPAMFLIDRRGVLRNVDALEKFDEEIPKLLQEK